MLGLLRSMKIYHFLSSFAFQCMHLRNTLRTLVSFSKVWVTDICATRALGFLYTFEESVDWALLSFFAMIQILHMSIFK